MNLRLKTCLLLLLLFLPCGFVMGVVHELGHAVWGIALGGTLTYMKVAYFEIYPTFAITSQFDLGYVKMDSLSTNVEYGFMLLGGALTTNIVSWLLILPILFKPKLGYGKWVAVKILGTFGILDLPFYTILPQIGLSHWIFLGGHYAEPLGGARMIGIPDPVFYLAVTFTTIGLILIYFKPVAERIGNALRVFLMKEQKTVEI